MVRAKDLAANDDMLIQIAPAREAIIYEERTFTTGDRIQEHSMYSGKPSAELDLAWHNLLNSIYNSPKSIPSRSC